MKIANVKIDGFTKKYDYEIPSDLISVVTKGSKVFIPVKDNYMFGIVKMVTTPKNPKNPEKYDWLKSICGVRPRGDKHIVYSMAYKKHVFMSGIDTPKESGYITYTYDQIVGDLLDGLPIEYWIDRFSNNILYCLYEDKPYIVDINTHYHKELVGVEMVDSVKKSMYLDIRLSSKYLPISTGVRLSTLYNKGEELKLYYEL